MQRLALILFPFLWLVFPVCGAPASDSRITLSVVVKDKSGAPVRGLTQQDFAILDNGQPQPILSFRAVARDTGAPLQVVLVVDAVNTSFRSVAYERQQIEKFLLQDGGKLAWPTSLVVFTDSGLNTPSEASRDGNALVAYLNQNAPGLRSLNRSQGFYGAADRSQLSIRALLQLAQLEQQKPGRKMVIWVSPGWPMLSGPNVQLTKRDQEEIFSTIVQISTALRQSGITLYSVDPLGTLDSGQFRTFYYQSFLKPVKNSNQVELGDLALQVLAVQSGGRVLNSNNNIAGEIETSIRDADAYYLLSFDARPSDGPVEYHAIQVKLAPHQMKAQARAGYYAIAGR